MAAVHRYEGTVNQIMGDGLWPFGAPIAHEDHAVRACYAALTMQTVLCRYSDELRRTQGLAVHFRVGLNAGEVVVRAISNDLHMDYSAIGQTASGGAHGTTGHTGQYPADGRDPPAGRGRGPGARPGPYPGQGSGRTCGGLRVGRGQCHLPALAGECGTG